MSDSYKLRIKHLLENNTRESISGEMIISNVTGHISVRDEYFVNSATKDIEGRNSALNKFYDYIVNNEYMDINEFYNTAKSFNKAAYRLNSLIGDENFSDDKYYNDAKLKYNSNNIEELEEYMYKQYDDIVLNEQMLNAAINNYTEVEYELAEIESLYKKLNYIKNYIAEQRYIFIKSLNELKEEFEVTETNYKELYNRYETFKDIMEAKYESLKVEFPCDIDIKYNNDIYIYNPDDIKRGVK